MPKFMPGDTVSCKGTWDEIYFCKIIAVCKNKEGEFEYLIDLPREYYDGSFSSRKLWLSENRFELVKS